MSQAKYKDLLIGRNALEELLRLDPQRIARVSVQKEHGDGSPRKKELLAALAQADIPCGFMSREALDQMAGSDAHQGFVAELENRQPVELKELLAALKDKTPCTLVFLDEIQDPQNLGAILRACECFGVDGVVWSKNRGVAITAATRKASVGASEIVTTVGVSNLVDSLKKCKDEGFWVVGADLSAEASPLPKFEFPPRTIIVLGAEGEGLKDLVKKNLDFKVSIPLSGRIESLNVSQAAAIMLYARSKSNDIK